MLTPLSLLSLSHSWHFPLLRYAISWTTWDNFTSYQCPLAMYWLVPMSVSLQHILHSALGQWEHSHSSLEKKMLAGLSSKRREGGARAIFKRNGISEWVILDHWICLDWEQRYLVYWTCLKNWEKNCIYRKQWDENCMRLRFWVILILHVPLINLIAFKLFRG